MKKVARVIITFECPRACDYCCNKYNHIINHGYSLKIDPLLKKVKDFDEICITGGEPMLMPEITISILKKIKTVTKVPLYMYSAYYPSRFGYQTYLTEILSLVDGIHYTLHKDSNEKDIKEFHTFQNIVKGYSNKSFRLYIHHNVKYPMTIIPKVWKRIEVKKWTAEDECELPKNETLFILK